MNKLSALFRFFRKAPIGGAFFIALAMLVSCANSTPDEALFHVNTVIDGDTLNLRNGEKVRFVGVNTPELGHGRFPDEPLANQAKQFIKRKLQGRKVRLVRAKEATDRHGRWLAHVFTEEGENVQIQLLERGLAFAVAVGKNLTLLDQYLAAEGRAKAAEKGVWASDFYAPMTAEAVIAEKGRGYRRIIARVKKVSRSKNNQILHLDGGFRVLIRRENWKQYFKGKAERYVGKNILVRGWIFKSHGVTGMKVYHPSMLQASP